MWIEASTHHPRTELSLSSTTNRFLWILFENISNYSVICSTQNHHRFLRFQSLIASLLPVQTNFVWHLTSTLNIALLCILRLYFHLHRKHIQPWSHFSYRHACVISALHFISCGIFYSVPEPASIYIGWLCE